MKQQFLRALRKWGLLPLVEYLNGVNLRLRETGRNRNFRATIGNEPMPPTSLMIDPYGAASYQGYWDSGKESAGLIARITEREFPSAERAPRVLDWGCGPARVVRHLRRQPVFAKAQLAACDCNRQAVFWARRHIQSIAFETSGMLPPLPYADASFDLVYGISIFTHLSEENHGRWIAELRRVLRPGGRVLLTFQGDSFRAKLLPDELARFERGDLVVRDNIEEGSRMYCAFHPTPYLQRLFAEGFENVSLLDQGIAPPQSTVSARKI